MSFRLSFLRRSLLFLRRTAFTAWVEWSEHQVHIRDKARCDKAENEEKGRGVH